MGKNLGNEGSTWRSTEILNSIFLRIFGTVMRKTVIISFCLCFAFYHIKAQVVRYTYHDKDKTRVKEVYHVKDTISNILQGGYISYYLNGNKESKGLFENNETAGVWEFFYETGKLKMRGTLKNNTNDGYWEYFYENGNKQMEGDIIDKKRRGEWKIYYESGELKEKGLYVDNMREGLWMTYYEDGKMKGEIDYGQDQGNMIEYYPTGEKRAEGARQAGEDTGEWKYFYKDGSLQAEGTYENSRKVGEWKFYYRNGEVSSQGNYKDGKPTGAWAYYYEDGTINTRGKYQEGRKSGYWGVFYNNGILKGETTFTNGEGTYKEYYPSGKLKMTGKVKQGKKEGEWKYYYDGGELQGKAKFKEGVGIYNGYYPDGTVQTKGTIDNSKKVGSWELYDQKGELSGYYKPVYDKEVTLPQTLKKDSPKRNYGVGDYRFKTKRFHYFRKKINEFEGVVLSINPFAGFIGRVPFGVEFYNQERLGHEFEFEGIRDPFFTTDDEVPLNDTYKRGYSIALKQKFYNKHTDNGLWYFGHEIRFSNLSHYANIINMAVPDSEVKVSASEQKIEYSVLLGYRLMQNISTRGLTMDAYISLGTGYRNFDAIDDFEFAFDDLDQSTITFRPGFGINIGYVFAFGGRGRR